MEEHNEKPSKFIQFGLILALAVGGFYVLNKLGLSPTTRTETTEWVDTQEAINRPDEYLPTPKKEDYQLETDATLRAIAARFANGKDFTSTPTQQISADETRFYNKIKAKNSIEKAGDWLKVLRTGHSTYQKVNDFLGQNDSESPSFYKRLEEDFDVSPDAIDAFKSQGQHLASDWALWLMEQNE